MSKCCIRSLALVASVVGSQAIGAQRPTDSVVVSQAGAVAQTPDRARIRGAVSYTIDSTEIMSSTAHTLSEVIQARVPSLSVLQSGGAAAQGSQIRSRGVRSFYMPSDPIVIIDGVRVDATQDATVIAVGVSSSRIDDIAPEDVARIDVLPGAAAANIYGPGASGGALVITTKHGGAPGLHFSSRVQSGIGLIATRFPTNYALKGVNSAGQPVSCPLYLAAAGQCTPTSLVTWNPLESSSPFRTAQNAGGAFAVDGGVRQTRARIGIIGDRTLGVTPDDDAGRFGARANVTQRIGQSFEISGNGSYLQTSAGLPPRGGVLERGNVVANGLFASAYDSLVRGYRWLPGQTSTREGAHHWTGGLNAEWNVLGLLHLSGIYGRDNAAELDERRGDRGYSSGASVEQGGFDHSLTTIALSARTADWELFSPSLRTRALVSFDQLRSRMNARDSLGLVSYPGVYSAAWLATQSRIVGKSVRQELDWNDRLLVGVGARWERWTGGLPPHFFKSGDLSWIVGRALYVDSLRLRAAYGEATNWTPGLPESVNGLSSGINPMFLAPVERVKEGEIGAEFALADRARFSLTVYRDDASHLYALQALTGGFGFGPPPSWNTGSLRDEGIELASHFHVLRTGWLQWDGTVRASTLRERTRSVGPSGAYLSPTLGAMSMPGSVVNGYYSRPYTFADANHDGLISESELQVLNSAPIVIGSSLPTRMASLLSSWSFGRGVSLAALLDYRGGQKLSNMNEAYRCYSGNCRGENDRSSSLEDQAQAIGPNGGALPYVEGASFAKLRELSVGWVVPSRLASWIGWNTTITVAGRNLATWTRYRGLDPELNSEPLSVVTRADLAETPIPREFLVRLDFGGSVGRR